MPLTVTLTLLDNANGCVPLAGAAVYAWHCDRDGKYSLYDSGLENENYLRGVQEADANGQVTFKTIYPGAYNGRWPHIHFEVFESMNNATAAGQVLAVSQIALTDAACREVYASAGYETSAREFPQHHAAVGQRLRRRRRHLPAGHHVRFRVRRLHGRPQRHRLGVWQRALDSEPCLSTPLPQTTSGTWATTSAPRRRAFTPPTKAARRLAEAGFTGLDELQPWDAGAGKFYVIRDGALIAWVTPEDAGPTTGFNILGAHTDSPSFKLKPKPTTGRFGWLQAGVEVYGGPLLNSWLDRELQLAGRLVMLDGTQHLTATGPLLRFPQLAIHLDRAVNEGLTLDKQQHMNPVFGLGDPDGEDLLGLLAERVSGSSDGPGRGAAGRMAPVDPEQIGGYDVVIADTQPPAVFGAKSEFFASGRLDNLSATHAGLAALIAHADAAGSTGGATDRRRSPCWPRSTTRKSVRPPARGPAGPCSKTSWSAFLTAWALRRASGGRRLRRRSVFLPMPATPSTPTTRSGTTPSTVPSLTAARC